MAKALSTHNPLHMFLFAEQYCKASLFMANSRSAHELRYPIMVCSAFSLEVMFKCILALEGKSVTQEHNLFNLFSDISPDVQAKIRKGTEPHIPPVQSYIDEAARAKGIASRRVDFEFMLSIGQDAFRLLRYAYEGYPPQTGWAASGILLVTRQIILEMNPSWANQALVDPAPAQLFSTP